jgi:hypothetical protein
MQLFFAFCLVATAGELRSLIFWPFFIMHNDHSLTSFLFLSVFGGDDEHAYLRLVIGCYLGWTWVLECSVTSIAVAAMNALSFIKGHERWPDMTLNFMGTFPLLFTNFVVTVSIMFKTW